MTTPDTSPLGKPAAYKTEYDPSLLFPIPRQQKREEIGIAAGTTLPFFGVDIWNAYEVSWLNMRGKPQVAIATFTVPADSPNIIESKSFKLYLNSYNQTKVASADALADMLRADLSDGFGATVSVALTMPDAFANLRMGELDGLSLDRLDIEVDNYEPNPSLLKADHAEALVEEKFVSHLLKSNCLVTGQPDWGSVQIAYRGAPIDHAGLLRYLVSFRDHNEFHEQCVERIFVDLLQRCAPQQLSVYARYTRRGGLDINPFRSSTPATPGNLRTVRQ
jgi:7-cyano-7-deazaguanine reductase